jgi:hypothetical protein
MLAAEHYPYYDGAMLNHELLEVHRSKISLHRAKADYDYPTIRLPHTFSKLAGLRTRIYQTVHKGALAFLVVISSTSPGEEGTTKEIRKLHHCLSIFVFTRRKSPIRIRPSPWSLFSIGRENQVGS